MPFSSEKPNNQKEKYLISDLLYDISTVYCRNPPVFPVKQPLYSTWCTSHHWQPKTTNLSNLPFFKK